MHRYGDRLARAFVLGAYMWLGVGAARTAGAAGAWISTFIHRESRVYIARHHIIIKKRKKYPLTHKKHKKTTREVRLLVLLDSRIAYARGTRRVPVCGATSLHATLNVQRAPVSRHRESCWPSRRMHSRPLVFGAHTRPLAFMFSSRIIDTTAPNTNFTFDVSVAQVGCVYTLFALS